MTLKAFATKHRLKIKLDSCGDPIVQGKFGTIYEYSDELLGMTFMPPPSASGRMWAAAQKAMLASGMRITQNGDTEGAGSFDPNDAAQAKPALKLVKARAKRQVSPETLTRLREQAQRMQNASH
jgi:hypothetical protein